MTREEMVAAIREYCDEAEHAGLEESMPGTPDEVAEDLRIWLLAFPAFGGQR